MITLTLLEINCSDILKCTSYLVHLSEIDLTQPSQYWIRPSSVARKLLSMQC